MTAVPRNRGAQLLRETRASLAEIADAAGVNSRETVRRWLAGEKVPAAENRAKLEGAFGVPRESWDEPAIEGTPNRRAQHPRQSIEKRAARSSGRREAERRLREEIDQLNQMHAGGNLSTSTAIALSRTRLRALAELGKITGETLTIDESKILRLPAWRRIEDAIAKALEPWPDAARALARALAELGE
jgi:transcriptional regulator with XRE-family HTH domain